MSNLTIRVLVALIGIPFIVVVTMAGGFVFFVFISIVSALALREFYGLAKSKGASPQIGAGLFFGFLLNAVFLFDKVRYVVLATLDRFGVAMPFPTMTQALLIILLVFISWVLLRELFRQGGSAMLNAGTTLLGVFYVSLFLGALIGLRELFIPDEFPVYQHFGRIGLSIPEEVNTTIYRWGGYTVISVFASIWICDSAAYFAGMAFGKHKLFERVSPNKTWEGAVAGFAGAVLAFVAAKELVLPYLTLGQAVVCGVIIGLFGQCGDLVESWMKRDAGVKDSSALIPGHGGVFDRFDSVLFVAPLLYLYLDFIVF